MPARVSETGTPCRATSTRRSCSHPGQRWRRSCDRSWLKVLRHPDTSSTSATESCRPPILRCCPALSLWSMRLPPSDLIGWHEWLVRLEEHTSELQSSQYLVC